MPRSALAAARPYVVSGVSCGPLDALSTLFFTISASAAADDWLIRTNTERRTPVRRRMTRHVTVALITKKNTARLSVWSASLTGSDVGRKNDEYIKSDAAKFPPTAMK